MSSNLVKPGTLSVVATPLGNPGDFSPRARQCLEEADAVLAEDTRRALNSFTRWGVRVKKLFSIHEHNESKQIAFVLDRLRLGHNIAVISDAGMPVVSDPGYLLVRACRAERLNVTVIPGPSALITALAGSGLPPHPFTFFGFLPRRASEQIKLISPYANLHSTLIFYERKDRLEQTLGTLQDLLPAREVCIARELTKTYEEFIHFRLDQRPPLGGLLGELTVLIGPPTEVLSLPREEIEAMILHESLRGGSPRAVAKRVQARAPGWTSRQIYSMISSKQNGEEDEQPQDRGKS